jgi:hypothetical protein
MEHSILEDEVAPRHQIYAKKCKIPVPSWIYPEYSAKNAKIPFPLSMMDGTQYSRRCDGS